jgi:hypothetical protein
MQTLCYSLALHACTVYKPPETRVARRALRPPHTPPTIVQSSAVASHVPAIHVHILRQPITGHTYSFYSAAAVSLPPYVVGGGAGGVFSLYHLSNASFSSAVGGSIAPAPVWSFRIPGASCAYTAFSNKGGIAAPPLVKHLWKRTLSVLLFIVSTLTEDSTTMQATMVAFFEVRAEAETCRT